MEEALIALLLAAPGVAAIAGARVFPGARPQGAALPAVVINRVSGAPLMADDGDTGLEEARIQADCWGATYAQAKILARAVAAALAPVEGNHGAVDFQLIELIASRDLREGGTGAADYPFRTALDFHVWFEP